MNCRRDLLFRFILYTTFYFKRELNPIKLNFPILLDSMLSFLLSFVKYFFGNLPLILSNYLKMTESRKVKLIQKLFGVKYYYVDFPPDIYWNDYFRIEDFLPEEDDTVVDIGATIGDYSVIAVKLGAKVVAIEPSSKSFSLLLKNIKLNKFENKIIPVRCATYSKDEKLTFSIDETSGYLYPCSKLPLRNKIKVVAKTLSTLLGELNIQKIDLIKMDTEGFEYELLKGAKNSISKFKPKIIIETHSEELRRQVKVSNCYGISSGL